MLPTLFSFFLDYQCNFECAHCSVSSNPRVKVPMSDEVIDAFFDQIKEVKTARVLVFTGGETTLRLPQLLKCIARAKALGLQTRVVSNGWWAKSEEAALKFLTKLKEQGLDEINTSFDDFHVPYVEFDNIVNLVKAARTLKMPVGVGVIEGQGAKYDGDWCKRELAAALGLTVEQVIKQVAIVCDLPTPSGTGRTLEVAQLDPGAKVNLGCMELIKTVSVHPNGTVKACCGQSQFETNDLNLGNILEERLDQILGRAQQNIVYWWIHTHGPKRILERLGVQGHYTGICHACKELLTTHRERLLSYLETNSGNVLVGDILMGDQLKQVATVIRERKKDIMTHIDVLASRRAAALESATKSHPVNGGV